MKSLGIDQIYAMWEEDGQIDISSVSRESSRTPQLHNKYYHLYVQEALRLRKMKTDYQVLSLLKMEYYNGDLAEEDLKEHGWAPNPKRILRSDIPKYMEADPDIIKITLKMAIQDEKVEYLESICKEIQRRSFHIKNIIEFEKFQTGA